MMGGETMCVCSGRTATRVASLRTRALPNRATGIRGGNRGATVRPSRLNLQHSALRAVKPTSGDAAVEQKPAEDLKNAVDQAERSDGAPSGAELEELRSAVPVQDAAQPSTPAGDSAAVAESIERARKLPPREPDGAADELADVSERAGDRAEKLLQGSLKGMLLLNLGAALFGSNQVVIKEVESGILSPDGVNALRFGLAALPFAGAAARGLRDPEMRKAAFELGLWLFIGYTAQAVGLAETDASRGAFTGTFTVLTVPILVGLSGRKIAGSTWAAAAAAIFGVSLLVGDPTSAPPNSGDIWCVVSAVLFGVHKFRTESITARFEDTLALMAVQLAVLAGASTVACVPEIAGLLTAPEGAVEAVTSAAAQVPWWQIAYMGLATTALTLWIEMESLKEVSAPLAALIYTAEPLWGAMFAWVLLDERWGAAGWVGAAIIVGSSAAAQLKGDTSKAPRPEKAAGKEQ
ncbi:unnamed protein product [Pedinophyceae sp. YPF-701]|nr:unnamed protein product [Pedinophyceae sp. YPF-701]